MKLIRSSVSIFLSVIMILSLFTIAPFDVFAAEAVTIINHHWDSQSKKVVDDPETVTSYTVLSSGTTELDSGLYVVKSSITASNRLHVAGGKNVGLYLGDGVTLTCNNGIQVDKGGVLKIYGATSKSGKLSINMNNGSRGRNDAAIGSNDGEDTGEIIFHGGTVSVVPKHGNCGAGIGGGYKGSPKCITVWDGVVNSKCDSGYKGYGAAIGGGENASVSWQGSGNSGVKVYGGKIDAVARNGAGIGNGDSDKVSVPKASIDIYGGEISATAKLGAGIGGGAYNANGTINISGGKVCTASKGYLDWDDSGAGIGGGVYRSQSGTINISGGIVVAAAVEGAGIGGGSKGNSKTINITGGNIVATSVRGGAGIGGAYKGDADGAIKIENANVIATSKNYELGDTYKSAVESQLDKTNWYSSGEQFYATGLQLIAWFLDWFSCEESGAAIGGGEKGSFSTITIKNSEITANSGGYSAAIGSGDEGGNGGTINIEKSKVTAESGTDTAAIGGGNECSIGTINIKNNSEVTAKNSGYGAAIGGGDEGGFNKINIEKSTVTARSDDGKYGAGIGSGDEAESCGSINITDSDVTAYAGTDAAAIGTGNENDESSNIYITNSSVEAHGGRYGAGIGGGDDVSGGTIDIEKCPKIIADSKTDAAGIGGGEGGQGGNIIIENCKDVKATGGGYGAGIGGGDDADGGSIYIYASTVKAYGGTDAAGIGGGEGGKGGTIEISSSNVYAQGKEYGAGIGGGEDEGVDRVTIHGGGTVEAVAGSVGYGGRAVAIGNGDYNSFWSSCPDCGTLQIETGMNVKAGSSQSSTSLYTKDSRIKAVLNNRYAKIYTCDHSAGKSWKYQDSYSHDLICDTCGERLDFGTHKYNGNNTCEKCGATAKMTDITFVERDNNGEVRTVVPVPDYSNYTAPECTKVPDGYEFVCWKRSGDYYVPGDEMYGVGEYTVVKALYLPLVDTQYVDSNGKTKTVKARKLDEEDFYLGMCLTPGWYVIDSDFNMRRCNYICGDVNLILADGVNVDCYTEDYAIRPHPLFDYTSLNIYGQSARTGCINFHQNSVVDISNFNQYGGIVRSDYAIAPTNNMGISGGSFSIDCTDIPENGMIISGGNVVINSLNNINYRDGKGALELGWTDINDSIKINGFSGRNISVSIAEGKMFTDGTNTYFGDLTSEQVSALRGKTLRPVTHNFGEPVWEWEDDYNEATAVFTCSDSGCGEQIRVKADVKNVDDGDFKNVTAACKFQGTTYTVTKRIQHIFYVNRLVNDSSKGSVTLSEDKSKPNEKIRIEITPKDGCAIRSLTVKTSDGSENIDVVDNVFIMPESDVTVEVEFCSTTAAAEPYIDSEGEYHLGNVEWAWLNGEKHKINDDRTVGEKVESVDLSYFEFNLLDNDTYQVNYYTGPLNITELVIPKSFNGKPITILGNNNRKRFMGDPEENCKFVLTLNENITEIKPEMFDRMKYLSKVQGDTSNLKTIGQYAFSYVNGTDNYNLEMNLYYPGEMTNGSGIFNFLNIIVHLKHSTQFSSSYAWIHHIDYDFIDAHLYSEPIWEWDGLNSAKAEFTCSNEHCKHEETVNAAITKTEELDKTVYTASADIDGQLYTDTKEIPKSYSNITVTTDGHGTVTANKNAAYEGEEITLDVTPETGYKLKALSVKDDSDNNIEIKGNTFTMPAGDVTISASFEEKEFDITYENFENGNIIGAYSANYGDEVELEIYPYGGFELDTLTVKDANENIIPVENNKFTMPASSVTVSASFKKIDLKITYGPYEHGTITGAKTAQIDDEVPITITPDEGYAYANLYAEDDEWRDPANIFDNVLYMIGGDVTVYADFVPIIPKSEPYLDSNGEYHAGNVDYVEMDGYYFAVNDDGSVGNALDSVELSYFDFELLPDNTYKINKYTGPTDITELVIPKTYKGKAVTVVGKDTQEKFITYKEGDKRTQFSLILNENITKVSKYTFYTMPVKEVKGDTSNLNSLGSYAFSWANGEGGFNIDVKLDYPGEISENAGTFNNMNVTFHMKHTASFTYRPAWAQSVTYEFTDAHIYGAPEWDWNADYSSATARFECANPNCDHEESADAQVTREYKNGNFIYTAATEFEGKTYTDTKTVKADNPLEDGYHPAITAADAQLMDNNLFRLPSDVVYSKASLLGVQKKGDIKTDSENTKGLRFIAEMSSEYLETADDYGFEVVKTKKQNTKDFSDSDGFTKMQTLIDSGSSNIRTISCKGTTNTVADPEYGDNDADSTQYKYVTLAIRNTPESQGIAVRFYVEIDGIKYYSSYTNGNGTYNGCCTSYNTLLSLSPATTDEV